MKKLITSLFFSVVSVAFVWNFHTGTNDKSTTKPHSKKIARKKSDVFWEGLTTGVEKTGVFVTKSLRSLSSSVMLPFKNKIKKHQRAIYQNPYRETVAKVRAGGPRSEGEKAFLKRFEKVSRLALADFTGIQIPKNFPIPNVAISLSGGGSRAMLLGWAFVRALELAGLLRCAQHITALSGSSWFLWPWLASGLTLEQYEERLFTILQRGAKFKPTKEQLKDIRNFIFRALAFDRPLTIVDLFSCVLGLIHFYGFGKNNDPLQTYMDTTHIQKALTDLKVPYPLSSFVSIPDMRWFSVTPHEVGSVGLGFVPWWAFGRKFKRGKSVDEGGRLGIQEFNAISSAIMAQTLQMAYKSYFSDVKNRLIKKILRTIMIKLPTSRLRPLYAEEFNPFYKMSELSLFDKFFPKALRGSKRMKFADAGFSNNYPIVPILERAKPGVPTIMFVADASKTLGPVQLQGVKEYADGKNSTGTQYSFPDPAKVEGLGTKGMSIVKNDDVLLFLFPRVIDKNLLQRYKKSPNKKVNGINLEPYARRLTYDMSKRMKGPYRTYNFKYTKQEAEDLAAAITFNVLANLEEIRKTMRSFIQAYLSRAKRAVSLKGRFKKKRQV